MFKLKREQQRLIGLLIESGVYKHPDGRHLYELNVMELERLQNQSQPA